MTVATDTKKKLAAKEAAETVTAKRNRIAAAIGDLIVNLAANERAIGKLLSEVRGTFPETADGRKAFAKWSENATGRKYGMVKRWIIGADVLHRVPSFEAISTRADTLQFVSGLPDADIAEIAIKLDGKPSTEKQVRAAALKVSEAAKTRETKRTDREAKATESDRVKNNAAVEQLVRRHFAKFADDINTLSVEAESNPSDAILLAAATFASLAGKHAMMPRAIRAMIVKYGKGDHLETDAA